MTRLAGAEPADPARRAVLNQIEGLMNGVDRSDQEIGAHLGQFVRGRKHKFRHTCPVIRINALYVFGEGVAVHRNFRMIVPAEEVGAL